MSIRPEDVVPDEVNFAKINGVRVRKGTVGAVLANAKILSEDADCDEAAILDVIKEFAPALVAIGMHEHVIWKNPAIQRLMDDAALTLGS